MAKSPDERFDSNVDKSGSCWIWKGSTAGNGYGQFCINYTKIYTHRFSYERFIGPIPKNMHVLHMCDNPPCVNPNHLFVGTHSDNMKDCVNKNRAAYGKGESHKLAKLVKEDVINIRKLYATTDLTQRKIAKLYNITQSNVYCICNNKSWRIS